MTVFAIQLEQWFLDNARDLPWRLTDDAYKIWLSEIILQQTQVKMGLPYYNRIVAKYPNVKSLSKADADEFKREWQGLGYYRRADNLLKAAQQIMSDFNGVFPDSYRDILLLKGVGEYTAAAIASFAYNEAVPVIDGNVKRVIARLFGINDDLTKSIGQKKLRKALDSVFDEKNPAMFNQAIMEFGALQCTKSPKCEMCLFNARCYAYEHDCVSDLPFRKKPIERKQRFFHFFLHIVDGKIAMCKRADNDIWAGLYQLPMIETLKAFKNLSEIEKTVIKDLNVSALNNLLFVRREAPHILSHQEINASIHLLFSENKIQGVNYYHWQEVENLPKPRLVERILLSDEMQRIIFPDS